MDGVELTLACNIMTKFENAHDGKSLEPAIALAMIQAYAAIAQAEAQARQAAALEKIASSLCMDNDLSVIDALYAVVEALTKTMRGV